MGPAVPTLAVSTPASGCRFETWSLQCRDWSIHSGASQFWILLHLLGLSLINGLSWQAPLNSCTANAICTAWRYAQHFVEPGFIPSRLFVYYNERYVERTTPLDNGAKISDGCISLLKNGVCSEQTWPYDPEREPILPPRYAYDEARQHVIHTPAKIDTDNIDFLKYSLLENKPFVVGIAVFPGMEDENARFSGRVPMPLPGQTPIGGHAVLCVGYNDLEQVWIFRNSWGPTWGVEGWVLAFSLNMLSHLIE